LQRAIQQLRGRVRGGLRRKEAKRQGLVADLAELTRLTRPWNDFQERVWASGASDYEQEVRGLKGEAAGNVAAMLDEATRNLWSLFTRAGEAAKLVEALRKALPAR